jgi:hypothetical protein
MTDSEASEAVEVPIRCSECGTESAVALDDVADRLARHNERLHDGAECAEVDPAIADHLADLVADDMGLFDEEG